MDNKQLDASLFHFYAWLFFVLDNPGSPSTLFWSGAEIKALYPAGEFNESLFSDGDNGAVEMQTSAHNPTHVHNPGAPGCHVQGASSDEL